MQAFSLGEYTVFIDDTSEFAATARSNHARMREQVQLLLEIEVSRKSRILDLPTAERIGEIVTEMNRCARIAVVFGAIAAESFIYSCAVRSLGKSYVKRHLDKLDLVSKWVVIPRLISGFEFPRNGQVFELLQGLVSARNAVVHAKLRSVNLAEIAFHDLEKYFTRHTEHADSTIRALDELTKLASQFVDSGFAEAHLGGETEL